MTQAELVQELKSLGMPVAYSHFIDQVSLPYLVYQFVYSNDMMADDVNALEVSNFQIELYTRTKDLAKEKLVQDKLKSLYLPYHKVETFIESENLRQVIYEIQLM
ncbi:MAG TPA: hypothetical protein VFC74_03995 [Oscillospiraceae bacterium]|nr:hypothetical protein [Oscillospiraceae bacterium]